MTALTLVDDNKDNPAPWASLVEVGVKKIETRKWYTRFRGDLLICASKSSKTANAGKAVCVVEVYECPVFSQEHVQEACCDLYPGFAWRLKNLRWLSEKFYVKGSLGLFQVDLPTHINVYTPTEEQLEEAKFNLLNAYQHLDELLFPD